MEHTHPRVRAAVSEINDFADANGLSLGAWHFQPSEIGSAVVYASFRKVDSVSDWFEPLRKDGRINLSDMPKIVLLPSGGSLNKLFNPFK